MIVWFDNYLNYIGLLVTYLILIIHLFDCRVLLWAETAAAGRPGAGRPGWDRRGRAAAGSLPFQPFVCRWGGHSALLD
jgi:hypothetical protein